MSGKIITSSKKYYRNLVKLSINSESEDEKSMASMMVPLFDSVLNNELDVKDLEVYLDDLESQRVLHYIVKSFIEFYPD